MILLLQKVKINYQVGKGWFHQCMDTVLAKGNNNPWW